MKERLYRISDTRKRDTETDFYRYLYHEIDWEQKLILVKGARGSGKTTLLLQRFKMNPKNSIYLSLDDFYFESNRLVLLIENLYNEGFTTFYLDEVHQYNHWSKDLKNVYDNFQDIKIVATGSSALQLDKGTADLSRRMTIYNLYGMSFREYVFFEKGINLETFALEDILKNHIEITSGIADAIQPLTLFRNYLKYGYYPFYKSEKKFYHQKLQQTIHLTLDVDLPSIDSISFATVKGMKNLLFVLSQIVPYTPNIQSLADKTGSQRNFILRALDLMEKSGILNLLRTDNQGISYLQKPEKIFLENPNLAYVFSGNDPNKGNLRETFFFNQLRVKHEVTSSRFGDFMIDQTYTFEVGGAAKSKKQIAGVPLSYIAADDIEHGNKNRIPLWLFGFLY